MSYNAQGYTLVELLVAIAVTSILVAGTYAAYSIFSHQQRVLLSRSELDRNALRVIDLMQSDIRMAGFTYSGYPLVDPPIASSTDKVSFIYDDIYGVDKARRVLIHYCLDQNTQRLLRQQITCPNTTPVCALNSPANCDGEPLLEGVATFNVDKKNIKTAGIAFVGMPQIIQVTLGLNSLKKFEATTYQPTTKSFVFLERVRNVSLVP